MKFKIICKSYEHWITVQEYFFSKNIVWRGLGKNLNSGPTYRDFPVYLIYNTDGGGYLTWSEMMDHPDLISLPDYSIPFNILMSQLDSEEIIL